MQIPDKRRIIAVYFEIGWSSAAMVHSPDNIAEPSELDKLSRDYLK